jgi:hypothetical protein
MPNSLHVDYALDIALFRFLFLSKELCFLLLLLFVELSVRLHQPLFLFWGRSFTLAARKSAKVDFLNELARTRERLHMLSRHNHVNNVHQCVQNAP